MIPIVTRIRAKSAEEFGALVHHSGEEYIYVLEGGIKVLTEFYDPVVLGVGESIYIDSNMGHAYVTAEGCDEAMVLGVCSSTEEDLMESLLSLHGDTLFQRRQSSRSARAPQSGQSGAASAERRGPVRIAGVGQCDAASTLDLSRGAVSVAWSPANKNEPVLYVYNRSMVEVFMSNYIRVFQYSGRNTDSNRLCGEDCRRKAQR